MPVIRFSKRVKKSIIINNNRYDIKSIVNK